MQKQARSTEDGMALLVATAFVAVALVILSSLTARLISQRRQVDYFVTAKHTFHGLDSAFAHSMLELEGGQDGLVGMDGWTPAAAPSGMVLPSGLVLPSFDDDGLTPLSIASMPDVDFFAFATPWETNGLDDNGDGAIDDLTEAGFFSIYTYAKDGNVKRMAETILAGQNVNPWNNAIFAGAGQAGGLISGNVSIHGAVHLLGENVLPGAPAISALDLSGASLIHNNYGAAAGFDLNAGLANRIPPLPLRLFDGEMIQSLDAKLRVKNGLVALSGASEIGEPNVVGNDIKDTMDGTYVSDGWTGNAVIDDGDRGDPLTVFSDNGWDEGYDLGNKVALPMFEDDWRDPVTGDKIWDPVRNDWYEHSDYFNEVLLGDPADPNDGVHVGDITINVKDDHYYWNATTGEELIGELPAVPPGPDDDYILVNKDTNVMLINGQITIDGNLTIVGQGADMSLDYSGRGAIMVSGDALIDVNMRTCNNGNPADTIDSYPENNVLGVMVENNMVVGSSATLEIMGAFYAQNQIKCEKQTIVVGTFVSDYFDMGGQVPDIYQVPALADNLPLGMVGNYAVIVFSRVSWREMQV